RRLREEAERRSRAQAVVRYTEHETGLGSNVDPNSASSAQMRLIANLGMAIQTPLTKRAASRIIDQLKLRTPPEKVAQKHGLLPDQWEPKGPSGKQRQRLGQIGCRDAAQTVWDADQIIGAKADPTEFERRKLADIRDAAGHDKLT